MTEVEFPKRMAMWSKEEIGRARNVSIRRILIGLKATYDFVEFHDPPTDSRTRIKLRVLFREREFLFRFKKEEWMDELVPKIHPQHRGNGAVDFVMHVANMNYYDAVQTCLNINATVSR